MYDRKVEIDKLEQLEHTQKADVSTILDTEDVQIEPMVEAIDVAVAAPDRDAKPAWAHNLELADHFTDPPAVDELVKHVHNLMADDVAALVQEQTAADDDDVLEHEGLIPDFFADTEQASGTDDKPQLDDTMLVSSANRSFIEEDDPWNSGGGGGGGAPAAPPGGSDDDGTPPEDPKDPKDPKHPKDPKDQKVVTELKPSKPEKPEPKPQKAPAAPPRDDKGGRKP